MAKLSRKEQERLARKRDILDTAAVLFSEKDFHEVTVDEIAGRVGLSKGTIYLYFKNKDDIFFSVIEEKTKILFSRLQSAVEGDAPYLEKLKKFIRSYLLFFEEHKSFFKIVHSEKGRINTQVKGKMKKHMLDSFQAYISLLQDFIKQGQKYGILKDFPSLTLTKALKGFMDEFTFHWVFTGAEGSLSEETQNIIDLFLHGAGK